MSQTFGAQKRDARALCPSVYNTGRDASYCAGNCLKNGYRDEVEEILFF